MNNCCKVSLKDKGHKDEIRGLNWYPLTYRFWYRKIKYKRVSTCLLPDLSRIHSLRLHYTVSPVNVYGRFRPVKKIEIPPSYPVNNYTFLSIDLFRSYSFCMSVCCVGGSFEGTGTWVSHGFLPWRSYGTVKGDLRLSACQVTRVELQFSSGMERTGVCFL